MAGDSFWRFYGLAGGAGRSARRLEQASLCVPLPGDREGAVFWRAPTPSRRTSMNQTEELAETKGRPSRNTA